jgi:sporulation protein YlmC with PRC-barrel domain
MIVLQLPCHALSSGIQVGSRGRKAFNCIDDYVTHSQRISPCIDIVHLNPPYTLMFIPVPFHQQIASAEKVDVHASSHNVDQLIGIDVVNRHGDSLGSVYDMIIDPATGKVAYLMIVRGGIFGFDEKVVPVPWHDFGITIGSHLLALNASKVNMDAAPQTSKHQYSIGDQFRKESPAVDEYWLIHLSK